ncbi:MAG: DUF4177 domain-containing protein [Spirochaetaceae bacterium]|jgi:hypothetical protein|nr:DUF4177 domain-containing protein [Spirochaetaceae bacterium]
MKKYKVWMLNPTKKFVPEEIEQELNTYAEQGWRVVSSNAGKFCVNPQRSDIIIILEKDE